MMDTECTQGEWRADYRPGHDSRDRREWGWAEVVTGDDAILRADRGTDEDIANVEMAAAAKDMYEALEELIALDRTFSAPLRQIEAVASRNKDPMARAVLRARKAIAKARGEKTDEAPNVRREAG